VWREGTQNTGRRDATDKDVAPMCHGGNQKKFKGRGGVNPPLKKKKSVEEGEGEESWISGGNYTKAALQK